MPKVKTIVFAVLCMTFFATCKKEHDRPEWDIGVLGPLIKGSLGITNLINDTLVKVNPDKSVTLIYEKSLYSLNIDSFVRIPDTTIVTIVPTPLLPQLTLNKNQTLVLNDTNTTRLAVNNVQLRYAIVKSGKIEFKVTNYLHTRVFFNYTIPGAKLNNVPLSINTYVDSATSAGPSELQMDADLSGYDIDLTGANGTGVNTIYYLLTPYTDPKGPIITVPAFTHWLDINNTFKGIIPYYVKGYLGQTTVNIGPDSTLLDLFKTIKSGTLDLEAATMKLNIENDIGMDAVLKVNDIHSYNSNTNNSAILSAPTLINKPLNINRAGASGTDANPGYIRTFYNIQIDNSNSNFKSLLNNLPDYLAYKLTLQTNPLGNVSGSNDFAFADYLVNTKISLEIPLNLSLDHLIMTDTADFSIVGDTTLNNLGAGSFFFNIDNGFPFAMNVTLVTIDSLNHPLDVLVSNGNVLAAPLDINYKVTGKQRTQFIIPVDESRIALLRRAKRMIVTAAFTTAALPQHVKFYSDYSLDFKLIGNLIYHVR